MELYDSEILMVEKVLERLGEKQRTAQNLEAFRKEIVERFAEIGFAVTAKVFETNQDDVYAFDVQIDDRTAPHVMDRDKQVHEAVEDILEILPPSERGWIKTGTMLETNHKQH
jgi:hypothetical protein